MNMKRIWNDVKRFLSEVWLGIRIAESNRHRSGWGKF